MLVSGRVLDVLDTWITSLTQLYWRRLRLARIGWNLNFFVQNMLVPNKSLSQWMAAPKNVYPGSRQGHGWFLLGWIVMIDFHSKNGEAGQPKCKKWWLDLTFAVFSISGNASNLPQMIITVEFYRCKDNNLRLLQHLGKLKVGIFFLEKLRPNKWDGTHMKTYWSISNARCHICSVLQTIAVKVTDATDSWNILPFP